MRCTYVRTYVHLEFTLLFAGLEGVPRGTPGWLSSRCEGWVRARERVSPSRTKSTERIRNALNDLSLSLSLDALFVRRSAVGTDQTPLNIYASKRYDDRHRCWKSRVTFNAVSTLRQGLHRLAKIVRKRREKGVVLPRNISARNLRVSDLQFLPRHPTPRCFIPLFVCMPVLFQLTQVAKSRSFILCLLGFLEHLIYVHLDKVSRLEPRCRVSRNTAPAKEPISYLV